MGGLRPAGQPLGDTWEPEAALPKVFVKAFDEQYTLGVELCKASLREHFYKILIEFGRGVGCE